MRDRPEGGAPVVEAELRQMHDKTVRHGVSLKAHDQGCSDDARHPVHSEFSEG
jgi:hypothetical protein